MEFCRDGIRIKSVRIVKQSEGNPEMNGDLVDSIVGFAEARKEFHAQLLLNTLTINTAGVVSNADSSNKNSKAIAREIARFLQAETIGERVAGQTSGNQFESICAEFIKKPFLNSATYVLENGMYIRFLIETD